MAILPAVPGFEVRIVVNNQHLKEYEDEDIGKPDVQDATVTKYVEATEGAAFMIMISKDAQSSYLKPTDTIVLQAYIDGRFVDNSVLADEKHHRGRPFAYNIEGCRTCLDGVNWVFRPFQFSRLITYDGSTQTLKQKEAELIRQLGTIRIEAWRSIVSAKSKQQHTKQISTAFDSVPEKALKGNAVDQVVKFGGPKAIEPLLLVTCSYPDARPMATFIFKYRSRAALKALFVIPRSPSPVPLEQRALENLNPTEMRELIQTLKKREVQRARVKRELEDNDDVDTQPSKRSRINDACAVIDLTDD